MERQTKGKGRQMILEEMTLDEIKAELASNQSMPYSVAKMIARELLRRLEINELASQNLIASILRILTTEGEANENTRRNDDAR
jgi:flagellar biosynthesis protein FlhB